MPHIHTKPGQHDITTSAWIFREDDDGETRALVHMHRKHGKLMQIGGHVELDETIWQTIAHELLEEAGYTLQELQLLQPLPQQPPQISMVTTHPLPAVMHTHLAGTEHYHSDYVYAFIAKEAPKGVPAEGESTDLRWLTPEELYQHAADGLALQDVAEITEFIAKNILPTYHKIDATVFDLGKPTASLLSSPTSLEFIK